MAYESLFKHFNCFTFMVIFYKLAVQALQDDLYFYQITDNDN